MKIKEGFVLRNLADTYMVIPLGQNSVDFQGMVTLNETGAFLWERLHKGASCEELVDALLREYEVEKAVAERDVRDFIKKLKDGDLLEWTEYRSASWTR